MYSAENASLRRAVPYRGDSPAPFARLFRDRIPGIYPQQSWYSMLDGRNHSHPGKSLFRSRHYRVTALRYLDEVGRGSSDRNEPSSSSPCRFRPCVEEDFPFHSLSVLRFLSFAINARHRRFEGASSNNFLAPRPCIDVDRDDTCATESSPSSSSFSLSLGYFYLFFLHTFLLKYYSISPERARKRDTEQTRLSRLNRSFALADVF